MSWDIDTFKEKLEDQHDFPGIYIFKFIVPSEMIAKAESLWEHGEVTKKPSSKGTYTSVTIKARMKTADQVISVYQEAYKIEGLMAL